MAQLAKHADQLDQQYQTYFAGHPRFSRDPSLLRRMAEQAKKHLEIGVAQDNDTEARTRLRKQVELFESEARSIDAIQAAASEEFLGHEYRSWVDLIFARYRRNFAAQSRSDRPLHLLKGLNTEVARVIEQLEKLEIRGANEVVTEALKTAHQNQTLFADEIGAIAELRPRGMSVSEPACSLMMRTASSKIGDTTFLIRHDSSSNRPADSDDGSSEWMPIK